MLQVAEIFYWGNFQKTIKLPHHFMIPGSGIAFVPYIFRKSTWK
jgi:hypothetical protein